MSNATIRHFIIAIICLLAAASVCTFMAFQVLDQAGRLEEQILVLQTEEAQQDSYIRLRRQAEETAGERATLRSYFLERESDTIDFLNLIESTARARGLEISISNLEASEVTDAEGGWLSLGFEFAGSKTAVELFVKELESLPYVTMFDSLSLSANTGVQWQGRAALKVYLLDLEYEEN
jgi:hypothetical protein